MLPINIVLLDNTGHDEINTYYARHMTGKHEKLNQDIIDAARELQEATGGLNYNPGEPNEGWEHERLQRIIGAHRALLRSRRIFAEYENQFTTDLKPVGDYIVYLTSKVNKDREGGFIMEEFALPIDWFNAIGKLDNDTKTAVQNLYRIYEQQYLVPTEYSDKLMKAVEDAQNNVNTAESADLKAKHEVISLSKYQAESFAELVQKYPDKIGDIAFMTDLTINYPKYQVAVQAQQETEKALQINKELLQSAEMEYNRYREMQLLVTDNAVAKEVFSYLIYLTELVKREAGV